MLPRLTGHTAARLRDALLRASYDTAGVRALLGADAHAALGRDEPVPARRASLDGGDLGVLVRLLLLGDVEPAVAVTSALHPLTPADAVAAGLLVPDGDGFRAGLDVRPHGDEHGEWWVVSDVEQRRAGAGVDPRDVVVGIGQASISLARATVRRPVGTLLDLGTGCGVQVLHAANHARTITATDVSRRALAMAHATFALNELDVELGEGPWFEPVAGRRFDQIVCNPPFVVGPARVEHVYRDGGLGGDAASERVLRGVAEHLTDGGSAQVLASWVLDRGGDWASRVASWLPEHGVHAWVVQRDVADPALYVGTWLADAGVDTTTPSGAVRAGEWLDWFAAQRIAGVGFGVVSLRRTGAERSTVVTEDLRGPWDDPLGPEAAGVLDRVGWLAAHDDDALADAVFTLAPDARLDRSAVVGAEGWSDPTLMLSRDGGPGWEHEIDEWTAALLAGCGGVFGIGELIDLLAAAHDRPVDALRTAALPMVRTLVRHGLLLPTTVDGR